MTERRSQPAAGPRGRRTDPHPYQLTYDVIKRHIVDRRLPDGLVLLETQIADAMKVSRAPVRRALELLHDEGLVSRFEGRGYLVGAEAKTPLRTDLREAGFAARGADDHRLSIRPAPRSSNRGNRVVDGKPSISPPSPP